jgi:ornithine racemase
MMTAPRLEIDLSKIGHNASTLVERLSSRGIAVTGVTKAMLGSPEVATALLAAGVSRLGDSHIENIEAMRAAGVVAPMVLLRGPMISQVDRVVAHADVSFNTEPATLRRLSAAARAQNRFHGIVLMVELGDLREGIMPADLVHVAGEVLRLPYLTLEGIGTNLACQNGMAPDATNMAALSTLADSIESALDIRLGIVSGGNSANLGWALDGTDPGRVDDLRLGEAILLGRDPLHREPIDGLYTDAVALVAEVIESKMKPSQPWGELGQSAFGAKPRSADRGPLQQAILAIGHQDTDPSGLGTPDGISILGASSDHLVVDTGRCSLAIGSEVVFQLDYSALVRSMSSPFGSRRWNGRDVAGHR